MAAGGQQRSIAVEAVSMCVYLRSTYAYQVGSGDLKRWKSCVAAMEKTGAKWGDETTVGAGLVVGLTWSGMAAAHGDMAAATHGPPL